MPHIYLMLMQCFPPNCMYLSHITITYVKDDGDRSVDLAAADVDHSLLLLVIPSEGDLSHKRGCRLRSRQPGGLMRRACPPVSLSVVKMKKCDFLKNQAI